MTPRPVAVGVAAMLLVAVTPAAAAMDVRTFLAKVTALKARGMMALFSSDLRLLKHEGDTTSALIKAEQDARKAAGKSPLYCSKTGQKMSSDEMIAGLERIPPAERGMSLRDGFVRVIAAKNPCPAARRP